MAKRPAPRLGTKSGIKTASAKTQRTRLTVVERVGERIREVRKECGFSQDALAYSIPLDRAHIGYIENGKRAATIPTLVKIAAALDCEVGDFFPPIAELRELLPSE